MKSIDVCFIFLLWTIAKAFITSQIELIFVADTGVEIDYV